MAAGCLVLHLSIAEDDDGVADVHQPSGGTVDRQFAGAPSPSYGVGGQPSAVVDIQHVHLLVG